MAFQPFDLATLLDVRKRVEGIPIFWLNFFGRQINFDTPYIDFEQVNPVYRRLAPFVAPTAQGRPMKNRGSSMTRFSPAYVKPKDSVDPSKVLQRLPGETPYQALSMAQRRQAAIANIVENHKRSMMNREEWMAAKAIIEGGVTVSGEDYPEQYVDFGRDGSLDETLAGAALWTDPSSDPLGDIAAKRRAVNTLTGSHVSRLVFGPDAWAAFASRLGFDDPATGNMLDTNFRGSTTDISRMLDGYEGAEFAGYVSGRNGQSRFEAWVYTAKYEDDAGALQDLLSPKEVVGVGNADGVRCYGAIQDAHADYRSLPTYMRNWISDDPAVEWIMSQSAPLMVPAEPNNTFRIKVVA